MPIPQMNPPLRRSRSASMNSLAQVDLKTLDPEVVLEYARKVMHLQPQPAVPAEKLQMLFALSQKVIKWFLEDREHVEQQLKFSSPVHPNAFSLPEPQLSSLDTQKVVPQSPGAQKSDAADKPSVSSRILASAVAPVAASDIKLAITCDVPVQINAPKIHIQSPRLRPAEVVIAPIHRGQEPEQRTLTKDESLIVPMPVSTSAVLLPQETTPHRPTKTDALQVYLQVQRSVICMQKYVRGFMARRKFFKALEKLLQDSA